MNYELLNGIRPARALPSVTSSVYWSSSFWATPRAMTVTFTPVSSSLRKM